MSNNKTLKVFSSTAVAGMIAAAMMSSQAFAAVDAYSVKVGDQVYKYDRVDLEKSFLDAKSGEKAALYEDFTTKLGEAKGFYAFNDTKNGYVDYKSIESKFLESKDAGKAFDVNAFTESKDAKVLEVKAVKKAVVSKDGKVEYKEEVKEDEKGDLKVTEVKALNLKQVKIEFNKAVTSQDKIDDIEDEDNYTWESSDKDELKDRVDKVEIDESGRFAILTFSDKENFEGDKYERPTKIKDGIVNQEIYKLIIDENVTGKEVTEKVKFDDAERPEVKSIEVVGNDTIKVKFSEPIKPDKLNGNKEELDDESFKINNDNISVNSVELVNNNTEANIKLGTDLKDDEELKVEVRGIIEDYAGFGISAKTETIKVKEDTERPEVVSVKKIKKGEATLVFNKDIKFKDTDDKVINKEYFDDKGNIKENITIKDSSKLKQYYQCNESNKAYAVKIDGKELTMYFDEEKDGIPNGTVNFYIKSGEIETLWEKENNKIFYEYSRKADKTLPEVRSVKQDDDDAKLIKIKFSKELDDEEAKNKDNYEIKDENGHKVTVRDIEYNNNDKEVKIYVSKKLDGGEYKVEISGVEDKYGNVMKDITKKFKGTEKDARQSTDLTVNVYNQGETNQKIVVDFDTKMKTDGEFSVKDLNKYTLVAYDKTEEGDKEFGAFKGGKSSVNLNELYNSKIKDLNDGKKVEITLPCKDKDDSYDFSKFVKVTKGDKYRYEKVGYVSQKGEEIEKDDQGNEKEYYYFAKQDKAFTRLELQIGKVSDADGNVNNTILKKDLYKDLGTIDVDDESNDKLVRAVSTDEINIGFKDKLNIKRDDFEVYAVPKDVADKIVTKENMKDNAGYEKAFNELALNKHKAKKLDISRFNNKLNNDGNTVVMIKLNKDQGKQGEEEYTLSSFYDEKNYDHVLNYDGTIGKNHDVLFVKIKEGDSKNDYDAKLTSSVYKVLDNIAPALIDNNNRDKNKGRFIKSSIKENDMGFKYEIGESSNKDKAVEYYQDNKNTDYGAIVLTFEEALDSSSVGKNTFTLDKDDDFKTVKVEDTYVSKKDSTKVIIEVSGLKGIKKDNKFGENFNVIQNSPIRDDSGNQFTKGEGNQVEGISTEIGVFGELGEDMAKAVGVESVIANSKASLNSAKLTAPIKHEDEQKDTPAIAAKATIGNVEFEAKKPGEDGNNIKVAIIQGIATNKKNVDAAVEYKDNKVTITLGATWDGSNNQSKATEMKISDLKKLIEAKDSVKGNIDVKNTDQTTVVAITKIEMALQGGKNEVKGHKEIGSKDGKIELVFSQPVKLKDGQQLKIGNDTFEGTTVSKDGLTVTAVVKVNNAIKVGNKIAEIQGIEAVEGKLDIDEKGIEVVETK